MPFEPSQPRRHEKSHAPRDAESFATPEMESLAEQLARDAQWLARKYPAHKPRLPLRRPQRVKWVAVGAVVMLLLLAVDAWRMWIRPPSPGPDPGFAATQIPPLNADSGLRPDMPRHLPAALEARPPGLSFEDLNGAEKEAVLDLIEERAPALRTSHSL